MIISANIQSNSINGENGGNRNSYDQPPISPPAVRTGSFIGSSPPASGTWAITTDTQILNENVLLNGSIEVTNGALFVIDSSNLYFSNPSPYIKLWNSYLIITNTSIYNQTQVRLMINGWADVSHTNFTAAFYAYNATSINVTDCQFEGSGISVVACNGTLIANNTLLKQNLAAIVLDQSHNARVTGNYLRVNGSTYDCVGFRDTLSLNATIFNNTILNFHKSFFGLFSGSNITANYIAQTPDSPFIDGEAQILGDNIVFERNWLNNLTYDGLEAETGTNILVRNNTFQNIVAGCHIEYETNITLLNNTFLHSGIFANNCTGIYIWGNTFTNDSAGSVGITNSTVVDLRYNYLCINNLQLTNCTAVTQIGNISLCPPLPPNNTDEPGIEGFPPSVLLAVLGAAVIIGIVRMRLRLYKR